MKTEIFLHPFADDFLLSDNILIYGSGFPSQLGNPEYFLSDDELKKYNRLKIPEQAFIQKSCRAMLKILIGKNTADIPGKILLQTNRFGKPFLENSGLWFNVSHTNSAFIIAISRKGRIGIDMEDIHLKWDIKELSDYAFSEDEKRKIHHQEDFLKLWTMKEALLKAIGTGLTSQLPKIDTVDMIRRYELYNETFICPGGQVATVISNVNFERKCYLIETDEVFGTKV
jgi:4'-phosphopantetheinyl transferase